VDAGTGATATPVGPSGGTVGTLAFAVFGDVRPAFINGTSSYPTAVFSSIMQGIQGLGAQFVVASGDYMFASVQSDVTAQLNDLLSAESTYKGFIAHALGNHECTSSTNSNCPAGNESANMVGYMTRLVPFSSTPYYSFVVHTSMGDAKFIFIAANAWSTTQSNWLANALAQPSTYTFVVRHEPPSGTGTEAPGTTPSQYMLDQAMPPVTLELFGHAHEYSHTAGSNQVISGNAGAPLTTGSSYSYGYLWVVQRPDGNVSVTEYQEGTNTPVDTWAVTPAGQATN
jgi:hypothetical protein